MINALIAAVHGCKLLFENDGTLYIGGLTITVTRMFSDIGFRGEEGQETERFLAL